MMSRLCLVATALACCWLVPPTQGVEPADVEPLLAREIIGPDLALKEVQEYTESRVLPMPAVTTVAEWETYANRVRQEVLDRVVYRGEAAKWRDAQTKVQWQGEIEGGPGYTIRKLRYEALPGLWVPALLYVPEKLEGKVPVVLNVNGHAATGKATPYKQIRCINQAKRGMLALNVEWFGMGQLRSDNFGHYRMNQLDLCGTSGLAPFYLAMKRGLDLLLDLEHADPDRVAVAGLSGGGWQTIIISSLDTRVTLADPVAGYSSFRTRARFFSDLGDSEQTPNDLGLVTDYAQLTALRAPRPTLLTFNDKDNCCFASGHALPPLLEAAVPIYGLYGKKANLRSHVNSDPGTHNFDKDNRQAFYRMLKDHFYPNDSAFDPAEIECEAEVKTADQLDVELPADNADFHTLALGLAKDLPRDGALPSDSGSVATWQADRRELLRALVKAKAYRVSAEPTDTEQKNGVTALAWKLRMGSDWTVPAIELTVGDPTETVILIGDAGRKSLSAEVAHVLGEGKRALAVDPFYFGESKIAQRDFLFALLVASLGDRPLGVQASQVGAIADWAKEEFGGAVSVAAVGPRCGMIALVAGALEPEAIAAVDLRGETRSLKETIASNGAVNITPELFCFGLLQRFDIKQLTALVAPRPVRVSGPSGPAKAELASMKAFYRILGTEFDPLSD